MEEQFVSYELALKLKELGFNEECFAMWQKNKKLWYCHKNTTIKNYHSEHEFCYNFTAPLWQQAVEWCLDKLKLIDSYAIIIDADSYSLIIMDYTINEIKEQLVNGKTKEDCLEKLIELCKNN